MLVALRFPTHFIKIIMSCITSTSYSLVINGHPLKTFHARRGLRQGDPMSPLLFVLGIEYLSRILISASKSESFTFHPRCKSTRLTHICFADDLMLFCKADAGSVRVMATCIELFSQSSGLTANSSKSAIYIVGVNHSIQLQLAHIVNFSLGNIPFCYLGVPLTSKRLSIRDYDKLVDKLTRRIRSWHAKHLSYAARLQLINLVLMGISTCWCQLFVLPKKVINHINAICRSFLWFGLSNTGKPGNVSWARVCTPKKYYGLGIRNLELWNRIAVGKVVWHIAMRKESLWVKWIHNVYTKGGDWRIFNPTPTASWTLRKLCKVKE